MYKNFKAWNTVKENIDEKNSGGIYFHEREIWWCYLGANVGVEQDGKGNDFARPVLIFKKFSSNACWILPLSTKVAKGNFFFPVLARSNIIRMTTLPQLKMIDVKRLINKMDEISHKEHCYIKEKITEFLR